MGLEVFMPLIIMVATELVKVLVRKYGVEPPSQATPVIAVAAGMGLSQVPAFHTLPGVPWWLWMSIGAICGFAAVGMHQLPRLMGWTKSKRRRRVTDPR